MEQPLRGYDEGLCEALSDLMRFLADRWGNEPGTRGVAQAGEQLGFAVNEIKCLRAAKAQLENVLKHVVAEKRTTERVIYDPDHWKNNCRACGFKLSEIRGRHPSDPKRKVCAQCAVERVEELSRTVCDVGSAQQASQSK